MQQIKTGSNKISKSGRAAELAETAAEAAAVCWRRAGSSSESYIETEVESSDEIVGDYRGRLRKYGAAGVKKKKRKKELEEEKRTDAFYSDLAV